MAVVDLCSLEAMYVQTYKSIGFSTEKNVQYTSRGTIVLLLFNSLAAY